MGRRGALTSSGARGQAGGLPASIIDGLLIIDKSNAPPTAGIPLKVWGVRGARPGPDRGHTGARSLVGSCDKKGSCHLLAHKDGPRNCLHRISVDY